VYESVAVSSKGFYAAGTFLNVPMGGFVRSIPSGDLLAAVYEDDVMNQINYYVRVAADGYFASAYRLEWMETTFNRVSIFNMQQPGEGPAYNLTWGLNFYGDGEFSSDGSLFVAMTESPSAYTMIQGFDTTTGQEVWNYTYPRNEWPYSDNHILSVSSDGSYVATMTLNATGNDSASGEVRVFSVDGQSHRISPPTAALGDPAWYSLRMTGDGMYVVTAYQTMITAFQRVSTHPLRYALLFNQSAPEGFVTSYYSPLGISIGQPVVAVGWFYNGTDRPEAYRVPRVQAFRLPSPTPVFDYTWPDAPNNAYNDVTTGLAIDADGEFLAVSAWGLDGNPPGHEQVQLFALNDTAGPIAVFQTPGSMESIDMARQDADGTLAIAAGGMHTDINAGGGAGDLYLFSYP